ncbi:hypothetical protein C1752_02192 [Acaryochloris thomasi RCC1774]|uniref:Uncharacterized protein n=1 Tax=Acaryochloris thomasi RCC1774 TaxID=1764569 RepID=A0A2W1JYX3_9CYAN|nr:hypothetical protein [Acaryochloris thomasi]PZD73377.1 hypothetical protein C1752_02192 [Acaryochloris thomasi RCC1774]
MTKLFAVIVNTVPEYYSYKEEHPEHEPEQESGSGSSMRMERCYAAAHLCHQMEQDSGS